MRALFTGGASGGHMSPLVAVLRQLKKIHKSDGRLELYFLGNDKFARQMISASDNVKIKGIVMGKFRRYFSIFNFLDLFKIPVGLIQSLWYMLIWMPDVVFSKGGYDSVPVVLAAWIYRIPVLIHESDSIPGLANRLSAKLAKRIALSFEEAKPYFSQEKAVFTGNPVREELIDKCNSFKSEDRPGALKEFNLSGSKPIILVLGGSIGAQKINEMILAVLPRLLEKYEVIHQCGVNNFGTVKESLKEIPAGYCLAPFLDEEKMANALSLASLVVSRPGAASIFEISACGKASILVPPRKSASNHQHSNAFVYARYGGAFVVEEDNLTPNIFLSQVGKALDNKDILDDLSSSAKKFFFAGAAESIAISLIELGKSVV